MPSAQVCIGRAFVGALILAAACAVAVDPEQHGAVLSEDAAYSFLQEALMQPEEHKDQAEQSDDAQENQAEEAKEESSPEVQQEDEKAEEEKAEEAGKEEAAMPEEPGMDESDEKPEAAIETQSKEDAESEAHEHSEDVAKVPDDDAADEDEKEKPASPSDMTPPKDDDIPIWKRDFKKEEAKDILTPETARQKIEHYTNQAKYVMEAAPEEKRQKVAAKMASISTKMSMYEAEQHKDDIERRQAEADFKAEGLDKKMAKINAKTQTVEGKMKRVAKNMKGAWNDEQKRANHLTNDAQTTQVNMIESKRNKYVQWKEQKQVDTAEDVKELHKQAVKYQEKTAEETARFNMVHNKIVKKKKMLAELSSKEVTAKEEALKIKEQREKIKEKKHKEDEKLQNEKTKEKIQKTTAEVKKKKTEAMSSPETKKATDALNSIEGTMKHLQTDVAADMSQTSQDAVRAQEKMLEERRRAEARNQPVNGTGYNFTWNDTYVDPDAKKKCGPRVLCTLYNRVVKAVGGFTKYLKLDMEEREKLGADPAKGEASEAIQRKAFDKIASRFGITGERTEGVYAVKDGLPGIKTEWYNRVVEAGGGAAAVAKKLADDEAKLMKKMNDKREADGKKPLDKTPQSVKTQAFKRVSDMEGVDEAGSEQRAVSPSTDGEEGGDEQPDLEELHDQY